MRECGPAYEYFEKISTVPTERYKCKFCDTEYLKNHTKMFDHLTKKCIRISTFIKTKLAAVKKSAISSPPSPLVSTTVSAEPVNQVRLSGGENLFSFLDTMTATESEHLKRMLAQAVYASGLPNSTFDTPYFKAFFTRLRPSFDLPGRTQMSTTLLDREYAEILSEVNGRIKGSRHLSIQCDSWTNLRSESIVNIIVSTPRPFLYETLSPGSAAHNGEFYCESVARVIESVGPEKVVAFVTDNASVMKRSWRLLQDQFAHIICFGCCSHGLNLLCKDIMKIPKLKALESKVNSIVSSIKRSSTMKGRLDEILTEMGLPNIQLKISNKTRWTSTLLSFTSLLKLKAALRQLAIDPRFEASLGDHCESLLSNAFWQQVECVFNIMKPVAKWIIAFQTEKKPMLHLVYPALQEIKQQVSKLISAENLSVAEKKAVLAAVKKRQKFCIHPVHLLAHLFDPSVQGSLLTATAAHKALDFMYKWMKTLEGTDADTVMSEISNYRTKTQLYDRSSFIWALDLKSITVTDWWGFLVGNGGLAELVVGILNVNPTTATCERSFSTFKNIQTAKRNRLTNDNASKLVYVKHNLRLRDRTDRRNAEALKYIGLEPQEICPSSAALVEVVTQPDMSPIECEVVEEDEELEVAESLPDAIVPVEETLEDGDQLSQQEVEEEDEDEIFQLYRLATSDDYLSVAF